MPQLITTDIAIIGAGYSAAALVVDLVDRLPPSRSVTLVGPAEKLGRGVAYGTAEDSHLLNVPAGRMSATAAKPDDFVDWLRERGTGHGPSDFVPRALYGDYVRDGLAKALHRTGNRASVRLVDATADGLARSDDGGYPFRLSTGDVLLAETAVLCLGAPPARLPVPEEAIDPAVRARVVEQPWADDWLDRVEPDDTVILVGTGLTMVDQVLSLARRGHRGPIHAISRHGLLPQEHRVPRAGPVELDVDPAGNGLAAALRELRRAAEHLDDWRPLMDGLRPVTQALWGDLTLEQRARFLRHLLPYWAVHRHRMAPQVAAEIRRLRDIGHLVVHAGRIERIDAEGTAARTRFRVRGSGVRLSLAANHVVNCCGAERCPSLSASPLLADLAARGVVAPDPLGLGIAVDADSTVLAADGSRNRGLHAVGPVTTGRFWEITAVPDIRTQVAAVGAAIAKRFVN